MLRQFITAWQFLTIIPLSRRIEVTSESLGRSMAVFPLVGLALGSIVALLDVLFLKLFPLPLASALTIASYIAMYGGFHLDGLVDTVDGIVGGRDREHALKIMKESTIGAIGVVTLVLLLIVKYEAMTSLSGDIRRNGLVFMPVIGRWIEVYLVYGSRYAREGTGLGRPFVEYVGKKELLIASAITIGISWFTLGWTGLVVMIFATMLGLMMKRFFAERIGGITGDILGAGGELSEVLMLLIIVGGKGL